MSDIKPLFLLPIRGGKQSLLPEGAPKGVAPFTRSDRLLDYNARTTCVVNRTFPTNIFLTITADYKPSTQIALVQKVNKGDLSVTLRTDVRLGLLA